MIDITFGTEYGKRFPPTLTVAICNIEPVTNKTNKYNYGKGWVNYLGLSGMNIIMIIRTMSGLQRKEEM